MGAFLAPNSNSNLGTSTVNALVGRGCVPSTVVLDGFQSSPGALSKAVLGKFQWSGGQSKCNSLPDGANFTFGHDQLS